MTTRQIASLLGVQHECVRDACGQLFGRHDGRTFTESEQAKVRSLLAKWGRLKS